MANGWEPRPPSVDAVLATATPIAETTGDLIDSRFRLRLAGYVGCAELPDEFVGSVRVLVRVGDRIVVCQNIDGIHHPWPGGRRERGESHVETVCREVHEETGWLLDPTSLQQVGWLHFEHLRDRLPEHEYLYADFFMVVYLGRASEREGGHDADWTDTQGFEISSQLLTIDEAIAQMDGFDAAVSSAFVELARS